jgi:hypothetical protein
MRTSRRGSKGLAFLCTLLVASFTAQAAPAEPSEKLRTPCGDMPIDLVRRIDFLAFFPTEKQAVDAAAEIDEAVFEIIVRMAVDRPDWVLRAIYRELPDADTHATYADSLPALVREHGGKYPGFGCNSDRARRGS